LSTVFFGNQAIRQGYINARVLARPSDEIRFRLLIEDGAEELNSILWETLLDPQKSDRGAIASDPKVSFSRALKRGQSRQVTLRAKLRVRVLVVVSMPPDPPGVKSPYPINVELEKRRAEKGFAGLDVNVLATSANQPGNTSLDRILSDLDDGYDILYLV